MVEKEEQGREKRNTGKKGEKDTGKQVQVTPGKDAWLYNHTHPLDFTKEHQATCPSQFFN